METIEDMEKNGLYGPIVGHVGDGNFHVQLMIDPKIKKEVDTNLLKDGRIIGSILPIRRDIFYRQRPCTRRTKIKLLNRML